jgi:hypothetical protein
MSIKIPFFKMLHLSMYCIRSEDISYINKYHLFSCILKTNVEIQKGVYQALMLTAMNVLRSRLVRFACSLDLYIDCEKPLPHHLNNIIWLKYIFSRYLWHTIETNLSLCVRRTSSRA